MSRPCTAPPVSGAAVTSPADLVPVPEAADRSASASRAPGTSCTWSAARSGTRCWAGRSDDLDFATDARPETVLELVAPGWPTATWTTGIDFGTVGALVRGRALRDHHLPGRPVRPGQPQPARSRTATSLADDLRRRDFTMNAMAVSRARARVFADPYGGLRDLATGVLRTPADPARVVRRRPAADAAGGPVRLPARRHPDRGAWSRAMTAMAAGARPDHRRAGAGRADQALLGAHPRRGLELLVDTGLADVVLPELPALRMEIDEHHQHKDVYAHSLTVLDQAIALEDERARPGAAAGRAAARHRQAGDPAARAGRRGLASTTTRWSAPSWCGPGCGR